MHILKSANNVINPYSKHKGIYFANETFSAHARFKFRPQLSMIPGALKRVYVVFEQHHDLSHLLIVVWNSIGDCFI